MPPTAVRGCGFAVKEPALVVIDGRVLEPEVLLAALAVPARVVRVDPGADGLGQLLEAARTAPGCRLVVVCHGIPGQLNLGDRPVTAARVEERRHALAAIGACLGSTPIELYACAAAQGEAGAALVAALEAALCRPVRASTAALGGATGNWGLDTGGAAAAGSVFHPERLAAYSHPLADHAGAAARPMRRHLGAP